MGRARRADRDHRAGADADDALAMRVAVDGLVRAHDAVAAAQQRHARGHAEAKALQRRKLRFAHARNPGLSRRCRRARRPRTRGPSGRRPCVLIRPWPAWAWPSTRPGRTAMPLGVDDVAADVRARMSAVVADVDDPVLLDGDRAVLR